MRLTVKGFDNVRQRVIIGYEKTRQTDNVEVMVQSLNRVLAEENEKIEVIANDIFLPIGFLSKNKIEKLKQRLPSFGINQTDVQNFLSELVEIVKSFEKKEKADTSSATTQPAEIKHVKEDECNAHVQQDDSGKNETKPITKRKLEKLLYFLLQVQKSCNPSSEIVIAVLWINNKLRIIKSYFSHQINPSHPLDTPIINLILHACQKGYDRNIFLVSTAVPTSFEVEVIKILNISKIAYPDGYDFAFLTHRDNKEHKRELLLTKRPFRDGLHDDNYIKNLMAVITSKDKQAEGKGRIQTHESFLWCKDLSFQSVSPQSQEFQDELYMGLLYSALFILWNKTARPYDHEGRMHVATMIVDADNKPIAFSINTSFADNSITHAEFGMLLRYFGNSDEKKLPDGCKLYSTYETCEMCRAGLVHAKGNGVMHEIHGVKDPKVHCPVYEGYTTAIHAPTSAVLSTMKITSGNDKAFFNFCCANYLALKDFLQQNDLLESFPVLVNVKAIWEQLLEMRTKAWVGNTVLYDVFPDRHDPNFFFVKEKADFEKMYELYYGNNVSEFRITEKQVFSQGLCSTPSATPVEISIGNNFTFTGSGLQLIGNNSFASIAPGQQVRLSKNMLNQQHGLSTGYHLFNDDQSIGDYIASQQHLDLISRLYKATTIQISRLKSQNQQLSCETSDTNCNTASGISTTVQSDILAQTELQSGSEQLHVNTVSLTPVMLLKPPPNHDGNQDGISKNQKGKEKSECCSDEAPSTTLAPNS